jgi:NodT family efflux transporter outer membrane factor (OMF) lipoprotein
METGPRSDRTFGRMPWFFWPVVIGYLSLGLCGCTGLTKWAHNDFKVGPNYHPPAPQVPTKWIDEDNPKVRPGNPNIAAWWEVFDDPMLTNLIHNAAAQNITVRQAGIQILNSRIQRNIAATELLPQGQSMVAGYNHGEVSRNAGVAPGAGAAFGTALAPSVVVSPVPVPSAPIAGSTTPLGSAGTTTTSTSPLLNSSIGSGGAGAGVPLGGSRVFNNMGTSLNLAWELDFWGLFRRNLEAASASLEQSFQNYDELVVQLLANVATQYVEFRTLQRRLQLAWQNVHLQEPLVAKLEQQYLAGVATSKPSYFQLKATLENTKALIPPLEISLRQANNQLCVLLGMPVHDLLPELGSGIVADPREERAGAVRIPDTVRIPGPREETVVVGIPGDLLLRRPDVQAIERLLRIQSAQIGIAEAQMYPHIGINGSIGLAANRMGELFDQQSWIGNIGPSMTWNIANYGRLLANVRSQNNQYQNYVLYYQQAILNANQDAENALVAYLRSLEQAARLQASADAAVETTRYYYTQLAQGYLPAGTTSLSFYNQIFNTVNFRVVQQDAAAQAQGNIALNLILLYRALGGGWQIRLSGSRGPDLKLAPPPVPVDEAVPAPAPEPLAQPDPVPVDAEK